MYETEVGAKVICDCQYSSSSSCASAREDPVPAKVTMLNKTPLILKPDAAAPEPHDESLALFERLESLEERNQHLEECNRLLEDRNKLLEERGKKLALELDLFRQRRLVYWSDRFRNKFDAWHLLHPAYEGLKDDTIVFQYNLKGFRLLPSLNLTRAGSLKYEIDLERPGLQAILLAPIVDMPSDVGELAIRVLDSAAQAVLREDAVSFASLNEQAPCRFAFEPLGNASLQKLTVQIFAQSVDVPIRIFELRKYPLFGFARLKRKLFAGYEFS